MGIARGVDRPLTATGERVLNVMRRGADRGWGAREIARVISQEGFALSTTAAGQALHGLKRRGLVIATAGKPPTWALILPCQVCGGGPDHKGHSWIGDHAYQPHDVGVAVIGAVRPVYGGQGTGKVVEVQTRGRT